MSWRVLIELVALAAIWGASFLFMRLLAPVVGAVATADLRMLSGGAFLGLVFLLLRFHAGLRKHWKAFLVIGLVNSALPFLLYSLAAQVLPASVEAVLNALTPAFAAVAGALFLKETLTGRKILGLVLGFVGVVIIVGGINLGASPWAWAAVGACVLAPVCYAAGGIVTKRMSTGIPPKAVAYGSQLFAGLAFVPLLALAPPAHLPDGRTLGLLVGFGALCSGVAYTLYFDLFQRLGPTKTQAVTFLIPIFGVLWGVVFLGETPTLSFAVGSVVILGGTGLITRR